MDLVDEVINSVPNEVFSATSHIGLLSNITLLSLLFKPLSQDRPFPKTKFHIKKSYDYIIVGGGTAGSVMANRLSEKPCVSVLLLEAGGDAPYVSEVPLTARLLLGSDIDWLYMSEPQKHGAFSQEGRRIRINSGKALGGTSVLNSMLYIRGNRKNYDDWEAEGCTGWGYRNVLKYFKKLEDNKNIDELDPGYHRRGGPMTVEKTAYTPAVKIPILKASADMGYDIRDINGRKQTGIFDVQLTVRNQQRCSTAKAYLVPAEDRKNLDMVKNAFVRKIIIKNKRAVGVEVDYNRQRLRVRAKQEVIVSNGALRTPQLLMLSGIGPKEELEKFNINVVADLPVGKNLMDHSAAFLVYQLSDKVSPETVNALSPINILNYAVNRKGVFASAQVPLMAFLDGLNNTSDFPRQQLYFVEYATVDALLNSNLKDGVYDKYYSPHSLKPLYACVSSLLQPKSRGTITLRSRDPYDYPKIDPKYYQHPQDLRDVVEGMKICQAMSKHPALQQLEARLIDTDILFPGCERFARNEDRYFACLARHVITIFWHFTGTARMGQRGDPRSVVDPELRVIGVRNLRVVNAAVMPIIPSGNTNVPTMMVAEKAYDMMKGDIQCVGTRKVTKRRSERTPKMCQ